MRKLIVLDNRQACTPYIEISVEPPSLHIIIAIVLILICIVITAYIEYKKKEGVAAKRKVIISAALSILVTVLLGIATNMIWDSIDRNWPPKGWLISSDGVGETHTGVSDDANSEEPTPTPTSVPIGFSMSVSYETNPIQVSQSGIDIFITVRTTLPATTVTISSSGPDSYGPFSMHQGIDNQIHHNLPSSQSAFPIKYYIFIMFLQQEMEYFGELCTG